ncbi:Rha family transcriptional regulator [Tenacibaculum piscium]|uniref:Rha family transcriptional regulator n=1 Tax=Tenacibaculum piscium TaxID=1458515 RepID=UPI001F35A0E9|nr:Rha family transcriptional regulator [Tenacibaculum piscium]
MSQLYIIDSIKKMSSKEIAELIGKNHQHITRDIDKLNRAYGNMGLSKVGQGYYHHPKTGKQRHRCFELTKMQTFDLLTGYSAELRIKVNRRWAELEQQQLEVVKPIALPTKRKHNRLTQDRLVSLLQDVALIEDSALRVRLVNKLTNQ